MSQPLIDFYNTFFDALPSTVNTAILAKKTKDSFQILVNEMQSLLTRQRAYPFLYALVLPLQQVEKLAKQSAAFFITDFHQQADDLLAIKDNVLDPIRRFMAGEQKTIYDNCQSFLSQQKENLAFIRSDKVNALRKLLSAPDCYLGDQMLVAQAHMQELQAEIQHRLSDERQQIEHEINKRKDALLTVNGYQKLSAEQQQQINAAIEEVITQLAAQNTIVSVKNYLHHFVEEIYPEILSNLQTQTVPLHKICVTGQQYLLINEKDTDNYLYQLKQALMEEMEKGNAISL